MPIQIPYLEAVQSGGGVSQLNPSAAAAVPNAIGDAADTINKAEHTALGELEEIQRFKNAGRLADLQTQARQKAMEYDQTLAENKDPNSWAPGFEKTMKDFSGSAGLENLPPDVRRAYGQWSSEFQGRQSMKYQEQASVFSIEQAQISKDNAAQRGMDMGDYDGVISDLSKDPTLTPAEKERAIYKVNQQRVKTNLEGDVYADPKGTLQELESEDWLKNNPGSSEQVRQWGIKQAKSAFQDRQKTSMRGVLNDLEMGKITTEDELKDRLGKEEYIEEGMHDEMLFNFTQSQPLDGETRFAVADSLNDIYAAFKNGEISEEEYRVAHTSIGQAVYAFGARDGAGVLRSRLDALDPANMIGREARSGSTKRDPRMMSVEKIAQLFENSGAFGKVSDEDIANMTPYEVATKRTDIYDARQRTEASMESWLSTEEGKKADEEAISKKFKGVFLNEAAAKILRPGKGTATQMEVEDYINDQGGRTGISQPDPGPKGASSKIKTEPVGGNLKEMVKHFEAGGEVTGFHEKAYWDYGQWSIGYGTRSKEGETITKDEAEKRLEGELAVHRKRVLSQTEKLKIDLDGHQIDALTSFDYNTGRLEQLLAGGTRNKAQIASAMLLYRNAKGKRLPGLERRRIAEATLFRRGYKSTAQQVKADPVPDTGETSAADDPDLNDGEFASYNVINDEADSQ